MKLLFHQCCAPCSVYPITGLLNEGIDVHGYFYNPNIHPYVEYQKRLETVINYNESINLPYTIVDHYGLRDFIAMKATTENRCEGCYRMRMENIAKFAKENNFDAFSSSLLYSRYQNHQLICSICNEYADKYGVRFHYDDYRVGWQKGIELSKEAGMYRQQYCGCIFSEEERYNKKLSKKK